MKTSITVLAVGLLGVLIGSLAAQQPGDESFASPRDDFIFQGNAEVLLDAEDIAPGIARGHIRVYDEWVIIEGNQIVPRHRVRSIILNPDRQRDDFGDQPGANPNDDPDPGQNTPPKRRPFRED